MAPHLERAWGTYKGLLMCICTTSKTHTQLFWIIITFSFFFFLCSLIWHVFMVHWLWYGVLFSSLLNVLCKVFGVFFMGGSPFSQ